jgi:diguanylate cyclase (GGDEF)-like protein/PAS domain S-box-containing protein
MVIDTNPEASRVRAVRSLQLLNTEAEAAYDDLARFAASVCGTPIAVVNLIDENRAWVKAGVGFACGESIDRADSICSHAIAQPEAIFEVSDLRSDPRFVANPFVAGDPYMRFYAGAPLVVGGEAIGTLCVIDTVPRRLDATQRAALISLARHAVTLIEYRQSTAALIQTERHRLRAEQETEIFTAAVTHGRDGVLVLGSGARASDARVIFANKAYCALTGADAIDVKGQPLRDFTTDPTTLDAIDRVCEQGASGTFAPIMFTLRTAQGVERIAEVAVITLPIANIHAGYVIILRDGFDRKNAEDTLVSMRAAVAEHEALKRSEERFRNLFARTPAITYTVDRDLIVQSSLGGGLAKFGLAPDQTVGWHLSGFYPPEKAAASLAHHQRALRGESVTYESDLFGRKLLVFLEPLWTAERSIEGVSAILFDITDVALAERALAQKEALVERAERFAQTGTWTHDFPTDRVVYSGESQRIFGLSPDQSERETYFARVVADDLEYVRANMRDAYASATEITFDYQIVVDGATKFVRESVEIRRDETGAAIRADGVIVDITEQRLAEIESRRVAQTDDVTGLPNRTALRRYILADSETPGRVAALLAVHFAGFRSINDAYGRHFGDRVLQVASERLAALFPDSYAVRLENATFGLVLSDDRDPNDVAAHIHEHFDTPLEVDGHRVLPTIGIGIALAAGGELADALAGKAELAARAADLASESRTMTFDDDLAERTSRRATLDRDLREAIDADQFSLAYQPIVDARQEIVGVEALLRWTHPTLGNVPPDEFVAIAEANGSIVTIGRWVIRTACADLARIECASGRPLHLAINVSAKQFSDPELIDVIADALTAADLDPGRLVVEVTESTIAANPKHASALLRDLRSSGTQVSVDDFGTGYSSLSSLRKLPIDVLKIDRSFVMTTPADAEACAIVEVILGLAKTLGLDVVAEGVETAQQAQYLLARGCTFLQGYHFSRPVPAGSIVELLAASGASKVRVLQR